MSVPYQAVLLIAFGGPTSREEIRPFLENILRGTSVPSERVEEVVRHYEAVGGKSPLNEITLRQAKALEKFFNEDQLPLKVYVGMRNASPFFVETLKQMADDGIQRALGFILSSLRTEASWDRYKKEIANARSQINDSAPEIDYCEGWHGHPLFIRTWAELIQASFRKIAAEKRQATPLVFTAHSVPESMASQSPYVEQFESTAHLIAQQLGHQRWSIAYQSRSGKPTDAWLEPDIAHAIRQLAIEGISEVIVAPIGFVCDHVEILYDLDIEVANIAARHGVHLLRVRCPNDHPTFVAMIADLVATRLSVGQTHSP
jgi:ferrochelatase